MPVLLLFLLPPVLALAIVRKTSGRRKTAAWITFALLAVPLVAAGGGGVILSAGGLAWRSGVKLPLGIAYVAGLLALLIWAGGFLWRRMEWRIVRGLVLLAAGFLVLAVSWYGLLFSAIWAGRDRVTEYEGQTVIVEQSWMDWSYYAYHGPLIRGRADLRW